MSTSDMGVEEASRAMARSVIKTPSISDGGELVVIVVAARTGIVFGSSFDLMTALTEVVRARYTVYQASSLRGVPWTSAP